MKLWAPTKAASAVAAAFTSGRFFSRWSILLAFLVSTFLSVPSVGEPSLGGYFAGAAVAAIGLIPLAGIALLASIVERRTTSAQSARAPS